MFDILNFIETFFILTQKYKILLTGFSESFATNQCHIIGIAGRFVLRSFIN